MKPSFFLLACLTFPALASAQDVCEIVDALAKMDPLLLIAKLGDARPVENKITRPNGSNTIELTASFGNSLTYREYENKRKIISVKLNRETAHEIGFFDLNKIAQDSRLKIMIGKIECETGDLMEINFFNDKKEGFFVQFK